MGGGGKGGGTLISSRLVGRTPRAEALESSIFVVLLCAHVDNQRVRMVHDDWLYSGCANNYRLCRAEACIVQRRFSTAAGCKGIVESGKEICSDLFRMFRCSEVCSWTCWVGLGREVAVLSLPVKNLLHRPGTLFTRTLFANYRNGVRGTVGFTGATL